MDEYSGGGEISCHRSGSSESCADDPSEGSHYDVLVVKDQGWLGLDLSL